MKVRNIAIMPRLSECRNFKFREIERMKESLLHIKDILNELSRFIDLRFVFEQAPKYGIVHISFDDPDKMHCHPDWHEEEFWKDGAIAKLRRNDSSKTYTLYLNPRLDREAAAALIKERTGLRVRPEEVYYYAWFHECGHTHFVSGELNPGALFARAFFIGQKYIDGSIVTEDSLKMLRFEAEKTADKWAIAEFKKWRTRKKHLIKLGKNEVSHERREKS